MDVTVERSVDADTDILTLPDGTSTRSRQKWAASFESVKSKTNEGKISQKGKMQSMQSKALVRPGDVLTVEDEPEKGTFGRALVYPTKKFGGKDIDVGFLKSSLGVNNYYTNYGVATPEQHETLKTTYNKWLPYQFSDKVAPMEQEEFSKLNESMSGIYQEMSLVAAGKGDKEKLDGMIAETYGDGGDERVATFLDLKKRIQLDQDRENGPLTAEKIMADAFANVGMQKGWDKAVIAKQGAADIRQAYKDDGVTFMDNASATLQVYNDVANFVDRAQLWAAMHSPLKVTDEMLAQELVQLPKEVHGMVYDEAKKHGNTRAAIFAQQLSTDLDSHEKFDDMGFMKQFVYGAGSYMMSPTSLFVGAKSIKMATGISKAVRGWTASKLLRGLGFTGGWTAAAGTEAVAMNAPRLTGDHTYTTRDMVLDVALDTAIGTALPMAFIGASKFLKPHFAKYMEERAASKLRAETHLEKDLINEQTRESVKGTTDEQLRAQMSKRSATRRAERKAKETADKDNQSVGATSKGDTSTTVRPTGVGDVEVVEPIAGREAFVGEDGNPVSQGELDVENTMSSSELNDLFADATPDGVPIINDTPWTQRLAKVEKEAAVQEPPMVKNPEKPAQKTDAEIAKEESVERASDVVDGWVESGLDAQYKAAIKPTTWYEKSISSIANITGKAMSHRLQSSNNAAMRFIGFNILEDPKGFVGRVRRHTTAALMAVREKNIALSAVLPQYAQHIDNWAKAKGAMEYERLKAVWGTPDGTAIAKEFEHSFIDALNARKMGRNVDVDPHVKAMLDDWEKFTDHMHKRAVEDRLPGWDKKRKNYFPQMRNNQKMQNFIKKGAGNKEALETLFVKGMTMAKEAGMNQMEDEAIIQLARKMVKQADEGQKVLPDSTSSKLARAQARVEMDWSASIGDLKLKDFLVTDIALVADRYSSDMSGRLALNKVSGGKLSTDQDLAALREVAFTEHSKTLERLFKAGRKDEVAQANKVFKQEMQMLDDTFNMILGRPPRGGLAPELRHLKNFTTLTRMGILGTSQSIETGTIVARNVIDLFNDPETVKHLFAMSGDSVENKQLLQDICNITGRTKDMEYLFRPSQVLDEESMSSYNGLRQLSITLADKATGGDLKQPASRLLGKTSMFNFVQKRQSEFVQKSFLIHTDRYFNTGKGGISKERMIDLGLINMDGTNSELSHVFKNVVKKNEHGHIVDLQWKQWSKKAKEQYMDAAQRDEAQRLQQTFAGEAPSYYNNPLMNLALQFREVPLVAMNKQMARNIAFGDAEAAAGIVLNLAVAGLVRFSWLTGLGYGKAVIEGETDNYELPGLDKIDPLRYFSSGGLLPDFLALTSDAVGGYQQDDYGKLAGNLPQLGVLKDAADFATGMNEQNSRAEALQGLTLLGNTWYMDLIHTMLVKNVDKMAQDNEGE